MESYEIYDEKTFIKALYLQQDPKFKTTFCFDGRTFLFQRLTYTANIIDNNVETVQKLLVSSFCYFLCLIA